VHLIGVSADLVVEGTDETGGVGRFRGRVIALALDEAPGPGPPDPASTWLLVADDDKPAPVWVAQHTVTGQRLGR
jgi:hypothetical protein